MVFFANNNSKVTVDGFFCWSFQRIQLDQVLLRFDQLRLQQRIFVAVVTNALIPLYPGDIWDVEGWDCVAERVQPHLISVDMILKIKVGNDQILTRNIEIRNLQTKELATGNSVVQHIKPRQVQTIQVEFGQVQIRQAEGRQINPGHIAFNDIDRSDLCQRRATTFRFKPKFPTFFSPEQERCRLFGTCDRGIDAADFLCPIITMVVDNDVICPIAGQLSSLIGDLHLIGPFVGQVQGSACILIAN